MIFSAVVVTLCRALLSAAEQAATVTQDISTGSVVDTCSFSSADQHYHSYYNYLHFILNFKYCVDVIFLWVLCGYSY